MEEAILAGGRRIYRPQRIAELVARQLDVDCAHLADFEIGIELNRRALDAAQRGIAGVPNPREPARFEPAAHHVHVGAGTEPDEEPLYAFGREQFDQAADAIGSHSGVAPA